MFNETTFLGGYSADELAAFARGAGCPESSIPKAVAIAQAESGGNPNAYNPEVAARGGTPQGQGSYGLWQIYLKKHPEFIGVNLFDPAANAAAMVSVSAGCQNFRPWSTYTSGAFQQFLSALGLAPASSDSGSSSDDSSTVETTTAPVGLFSGLPGWAPVAAIALVLYLLVK